MLFDRARRIKIQLPVSSSALQVGITHKRSSNRNSRGGAISNTTSGSLSKDLAECSEHQDLDSAYRSSKATDPSQESRHPVDTRRLRYVHVALCDNSRLGLMASNFIRATMICVHQYQIEEYRIAFDKPIRLKTDVHVPVQRAT